MMGAGFVMLLTVAPARWEPGTWAAVEPPDPARSAGTPPVQTDVFLAGRDGDHMKGPAR